MEYKHREIEKKWQKYWAENKTYKTEIDHNKPKYYVLDMFPYPSGAGLHVGHPLGYIASDIYSRYKRLKGFNVLHPMGYDAYGLPAEQYAIQTGTHPAVTTEKNIARYREQMDKIGFSYDWDREVRTSDPFYYKWTQWTFIQLFRHWYNMEINKADSIENLIAIFEREGNVNVNAASGDVEPFTAEKWRQMTEVHRQEILMNYRLAYLADTWVNWCPALGTVLANDEVVNGVSERGGHPVERKMMRQWSLRITAYAQRLLDGLEKVDWFESLKEMQRYWIGRSEGAAVFFNVKGWTDQLEVFTTRPDTLWGATFMVLAPEHELVEKITTPDHKDEVTKYVAWAKNRSEVERMSEVKKVTGVFTGAYGINPVNGEEIPIWIADYVLSGYGTGAIMAVPAHDSRDFAFARHFNILIRQVVAKEGEASDPATWTESYDAKEGKMINSGMIDGLNVQEAIRKTIDYLEENKLGFGQINFKLRDAIFSRQRYWGEPFPIFYKDGMPYPLDESELPLELPEVDKYLPTESGEPPLARAKNWKTKQGYPLETNTMPGFAGSSGYYLRYMDPWNKDHYFSKEANEYWKDVDLYLGGDEHATGHLIYARFWNMFLFDIGLVCEEEPFKKLINQGKIQGRSNFVYRIDGSNKFVSKNLRKDYQTTPIHVDVNMVDNDELDIEAFKQWRPEFANAEFILENGKYICGWEVEKMSKSKHNVVNPDALIDHYGADTFRLYEMFLGPLESHKPWDTKGIEGVYRFIKKLWRLFYDETGTYLVVDEKPDAKELKVLHQTIKKVQEDIERFSFNTVVSQFMICANELHEMDCHKKAILEPLVILISSYAPHMAEELWQRLGNKGSVTKSNFPEFNPEFIRENTFEYPVSFNGKMRFKLELPVGLSNEEVEKRALADERALKWTEGKQVRKVIVVPRKIINIVVS
ncbi:MAG: leucine--tRNA ligase [Bacteroidetes bacterium]|nr:leucine--tRNA ligase [Bacteroidota bacterium]